MLALVIAALLVTGCGLTGSAGSPDAAAPCGGADEQRAAGFHADLEALLPVALEGAAPVKRDSGRYCSTRSLGTLAEAGFASVDFAGATWPTEDDGGVAVQGLGQQQPGGHGGVEGAAPPGEAEAAAVAADEVVGEEGGGVGLDAVHGGGHTGHGGLLGVAGRVTTPPSQGAAAPSRPAENRDAKKTSA